MNRQCFGCNFELGGHWYWRCLMDGTIVGIEPCNMVGICPHCNRPAVTRIVPVKGRVRLVSEVQLGESPYWVELNE